MGANGHGLACPVVQDSGRTLKTDPEMAVADRYVWWGVLGKFYRKGLVRLGLRSV